MTKIETLTDHQWRQVHEARADWLATGLSTQPVNRPAAEAAITAIYQRADPQVQGDVSFLPVTTKPAVTPIPAAGVVVASGREGHNHRLVGVGFFDRAEASVMIGTLTVPADGEVFAAHDEHGFMGFGPGTYRVGRQREQADIIELVAD